MMKMPSLFLPHGAPDLPLSSHSAAKFLQELAVNLSNIAPEGSPAAKWATSFDRWLDEVLDAQDWQQLLNFSSTPNFIQAHPSSKHLLPLIVAAGAGHDEPPNKIHSSFSYGSIGMSAWMFGNNPQTQRQ